MREDFKNLAKLWPYLRQDRRLIIAAALLIPFIAGLQSTLPHLLRYAVDHGISVGVSGGGDVDVLTFCALAFLALVTVEYLFRAAQTMLSATAVHRMIKRLRVKLINHVLALKCSFHDRSMSGALVTRATSDFDNLSESLNMGVLTSIVDLSVLIGCVIGMFLLSWPLALGILIILPLTAWLVRGFSVAIKKAMLIARAKAATLNAYTQECLYGNATVKLLTADSVAQQKYDRLNIDFRDAQMKTVVLDASMFSVLEGIASVTIGLILWLTVAYVSGSEVLSAGVIVAFVQYVQQMFDPLKHLANKIAMLQGAFTSIDRVFGVLERDEKMDGIEPAPALLGDIEFRRVSFSYHPDEASDNPTLTNIDMVLSAGQSLAIVGATGSGKSTLIKLLTKLYDGYSGDILIGGNELRLIEPRSLRQQVAIVPQDVAIFDGSIAFNISLDRAGVDRQAIISAARHVGADTFIRRLEGGYDFEVREKGGNLSQGQRQLLAFARALVGDPKLVVLDEATSNVDPESEAIIQQATQKIFVDRTVIVIAHRLSTIRQCDQILVLDRGKIIEQGDHESLLAQRRAYYQLHQAFA